MLQHNVHFIVHFIVGGPDRNIGRCDIVWKFNYRAAHVVYRYSLPLSCIRNKVTVVLIPVHTFVITVGIVKSMVAV